MPSGNSGGSTYHPPGYKPHHALEGIPDMATQHTQANGASTGMTKWQEYTGPAPEGLGDLPFYDPARRADTIGETDTHWVKKERRPDGGIVVRIAEKLTRGLGGNSQLGMKQGDAMIVDAAYAENAATSWGSPTSPNGSPYNANDVFDLVTPNSNISGINDTVYVQFKDPPNAQLWKADPQGADVAYTPASQIDQTKLVPQAQIGSNGTPNTTPPGGGPGLITKFQTASTTTKIVIVGGGVLLVGALGLWAYGHFSKKKHASSGHHAHHGHRARASAPRRRRRGRR